MVNSEGDRLSGLTVDVLGEVAVVQVGSTSTVMQVMLTTEASASSRSGVQGFVVSENANFFLW